MPLSAGRVPAQPTQSCDKLISRLNAITDNSATSPYLIKLEPGIYDCGSQSVTMKPFVDIEGLGKGITVIRGTPFGVNPTVKVTDNTHLRELRVESIGSNNTGGCFCAITAAVSPTGRAWITDVIAIVQNTSTQSTFTAGLCTIGGETIVSNVTVTAQGAGTEVVGVSVSGTPSQGGLATLVNVVASATGGTAYNSGLEVQGVGVATARNSVFIGVDAVRTIYSGSTANLISTQLRGNVTGPGLCAALARTTPASRRSMRTVSNRFASGLRGCGLRLPHGRGTPLRP